mgnify:FL=1|jgi:hypothetical protein
MKMNHQTKLIFALEHIAHLHDLIEENVDEEYLRESLISIEDVLESQLEETLRKKRLKWN